MCTKCKKPAVKNIDGLAITLGGSKLNLKNL